MKSLIRRRRTSVAGRIAKASGRVRQSGSGIRGSLQRPRGLSIAVLPFVACHDCDLLCRLPPMPEGASAYCTRCGGLLRRRQRNSIERTLALTLAASVLFAVANAFPFLSFDMRGRVTETTLVTGVVDLWNQGVPEISV